MRIHRDPNMSIHKTTHMRIHNDANMSFHKDRPSPPTIEATRAGSLRSGRALHNQPVTSVPVPGFGPARRAHERRPQRTMPPRGPTRLPTPTARLSQHPHKRAAHATLRNVWLSDSCQFRQVFFEEWVEDLSRKRTQWCRHHQFDLALGQAVATDRELHPQTATQPPSMNIDRPRWSPTAEAGLS